MITISNIKVDVNHTLNDLKMKAATVLKASTEDFKTFSIFKKSIDARKKDQVKYVYSVNIEINEENKYLNIKDVCLTNIVTYKDIKCEKALKNPPVIVGSGPAGIFAGIILAEAGLCPIIVEQGKDVDSRLKDVHLFWKTGVLNEKSNVQFGEGGAGTFSDGKLNTGVKDPRMVKVIDEFLKAGAPCEIRYSSKPHIGTDKLILVVKNMREKIISLGGEFRFENKFIGFNEENKRLVSILVETNHGNYCLETKNLILALGHSARDTSFMLYENGVIIEPKPFAVGVRIEHNQKFINETQYGKFAKDLPSADYKLSAHVKNNRGVFTFCMCPGGVVVAASSEKNRLVTNGMSYYKRDLENANSALLVSVNPDDFMKNSPLSGIDFQRKLEEKAFLSGGGAYKAPAQLVGDFLCDRKTLNFGKVVPSYALGVKGSDLREIFDDFLVDSLKEGILEINKKLNGFASYDAVLTAVESRSSSPITIKRNPESFLSNVLGIYPCGEGAGYAGGIMSAAVDGIKCAEALILKNI